MKVFFSFYIFSSWYYFVSLPSIRFMNIFYYDIRVTRAWQLYAWEDGDNGFGDFQLNRALYIMQNRMQPLLGHASGLLVADSIALLSSY